MMRAFVPPLLRIALVLPIPAAATCGKPVDVEQFPLASPAFDNGQAIPTQFTCDGANHSPPLQWSSAHEGTKSFALVLDDPDAPKRTFGHWGAYDIPASMNSLPEGAGNRPNPPFAQAINDFNRPGYGGPCPPRGAAPHVYHFKLYALDVDHLNLPANPKIADVEDAVATHAVARAEITGTFGRK